MTPNAAYIWLDALENLPPRCLVIFTTNEATRMPSRLRDRCERMSFEGGALLLRPALQELAEEVWKKETGRDDCPPVEAIGPIADGAGLASFRRLLQRMTPFVRTATLPTPPPEPAPAPEPAAAPAPRPRTAKVSNASLALESYVLPNSWERWIR